MLLRASDTPKCDIALLKNMATASKLAVQFRIEFFNAFDRWQSASPDCDSTLQATFVSIAGTSDPAREIQLALKLLLWNRAA
jgi:hypothetical protein